MNVNRIRRAALAIVASLVLTLGVGSAAHAIPLRSTAVISKTYSAQQFFSEIYAYDAKHRGGCKPIAGGALKCVAHDAKLNEVSGYALCLSSGNISVPSVLSRNGGNTVGVQLRVKVSSLRGGAYWKGYPAMWSGTFAKAGAKVLPGGGRWMPLYASEGSWWSGVVCLKPNATATIKSFSIFYRS